MTHDCKTCPVSTGTHKPAEAVHQIDEPQADALLELAAYRFTVANREARIAELEAELEAVGAGGVQRLAAAPQAVQAAVPDGWKWMSIPSRCGGAIMPVRVFEEDGVKYYQPFDWENETAFKWDKRSKDWVEHEVSGPAHPAEGVPAQASREAVIQHLTNAGVLEHDGCGVFIASGVASELIDACMTLPLSTHPTPQGLDAQDAARLMFVMQDIDGFEGIARDKYDYAQSCATENGRDEPIEADELNGLRRLIDAALAAQAKQGEQANG